jgi:cell division protein ZapA
MPQVVVNINGKPYRMACDEGQEQHLKALGERFDSFVTLLKDGVGEIGDQRLTVMAGVMATDELVEAEAQVVRLEREVKALRNQTESVSTSAIEAEAETIARITEATKAVSNIAARLKERPAES